MYVKIFPSVVLYFCWKYFTLVAIRIVFLATCSDRLLTFLSVGYCILLNLLFNLSIFIPMLRLRFAPGVCFDVLSATLGQLVVVVVAVVD